VTEVCGPMQADIVWKSSHFANFRELAQLNPGALVNQFPFEATLTVKDLLAVTIQSVYGSKMDPNTLDWTPPWFPVAFNLELELPEFAAYFQLRASRNLDNTWIIKPWNLARGLDMCVTQNLGACIRLAESGPKLACKYVQNPVLFRRQDNGNMVKFDLRYIVFVRQFGVNLDAYIYNNFWIRFAVNEFSLRDLDDVLTHLTVHNYTPDGGGATNMYQLECHKFIAQLELLYPKLRWSEVQAQINAIIKEVLQSVTKNPPPQGVAPNKQSRAMYGFDLMLKWSEGEEADGAPDFTAVQPVFIEANFMPDCNRACRYYEDFADTVFETLFLIRQWKN